MADTPLTIMVLENHYERRVYHSMDGAAKGLGWGRVGNPPPHKDSEIRIYRLDEEATALANRDLHHLMPGNNNMLQYIKGGVMDWKAHKAAAVAIMKRWW